MVSWWPCIVAKARALSRYIPRASGAALCFSKSSTTFVCPDYCKCIQMLRKSLTTFVCPALEAQTKAELPWLSLASTLASKLSHLDLFWLMLYLASLERRDSTMARWPLADAQTRAGA